MPTIIVSPFGAFTVLLAVMVISEILAKVSKGWLPSALTISALMLAGFWSGLFPTNIVNLAGVTDYLFILVSAMLVTNLGTLIGRKEMVQQWKTVIIALLGIAGIVGVCLTLGSALFGWDNAVAAAPPLTGGAIATTMVTSAAKEAGNETAAVIAIVCLALQGLFGYPLTAVCLKNETRRLAQQYRDGTLAKPAVDEAAAKKNGGKIASVSLVLMKLGLISTIGFWLQKLTGDAVSMYVWCLLFGFAAHEFGWLETDALRGANAYGLSTSILMIYLFGGLSSTTPELVFSVLGPVVAFVCMAAAAMAIMAFIGSKIFKQSFSICYAIILNAFYGFPINVMLTNEALDLNTADADERAAVSAQLMPRMLVGGFVCVSIVSVIVAGILVPFI